MAFIFSKVSQSFRQNCENCWVSVRMWVSWGHTGRLLAKHSSLSCHPCWGLSSLHRCMNLVGCPTICVYETFSYQQMPYLFSLCIQSCRTLALTELPFSFEGKEWHEFTILLPCLCTTEMSPFVPAWKVTGLKCDNQGRFFQRGQNILENHLASYLWWISACFPPSCGNCPCFLLGSNTVPNPWCLVGAPNQGSSKVMHGVSERSLPLLQRTSPHPP